MPVLMSLLSQFLKKSLRDNKYINLKWIDQNYRKFELILIHKRNKHWDASYAKIYEDWYKMKPRASSKTHARSAFLSALKKTRYLCPYIDESKQRSTSAFAHFVFEFKEKTSLKGKNRNAVETKENILKNVEVEEVGSSNDMNIDAALSTPSLFNDQWSMDFFQDLNLLDEMQTAENATGEVDGSSNDANMARASLPPVCIGEELLVNGDKAEESKTYEYATVEEAGCSNDINADVALSTPSLYELSMDSFQDLNFLDEMQTSENTTIDGDGQNCPQFLDANGFMPLYESVRCLAQHVEDYPDTPHDLLVNVGNKCCLLTLQPIKL